MMGLFAMGTLASTALARAGTAVLQPSKADPSRVRKILDEMESKIGRYWSTPRKDAEFLHFMVKATRAVNVLEVGTSQGYSAIWMGLGLEETGGRLTTIEIDTERHALAQRNVREAGLAGRVALVRGDAHREIAGLKGPFDFVFLDADKDGQMDYFKKLYPKKLAPGRDHRRSQRHLRGRRHERLYGHDPQAPRFRHGRRQRHDGGRHMSELSPPGFVKERHHQIALRTGGAFHFNPYLNGKNARGESAGEGTVGQEVQLPGDDAHEEKGRAGKDHPEEPEPAVEANENQQGGYGRDLPYPETVSIGVDGRPDDGVALGAPRGEDHLREYGIEDVQPGHEDDKRGKPHTILELMQILS